MSSMDVLQRPTATEELWARKLAEGETDDGAGAHRSMALEEVMAWRPSCRTFPVSARSALTGEVVATVEVRPEDRVRDLERSIAKSMTSSARLRVMFQGTPLAPTAALQDAGVCEGAQVLVLACAAQLLATASGDGTVMLWNAETGESTRTFRGHTGSVNSVLFTADGAHVKSTSHDRSEKTWNLESGECESTRRSLPFTSSFSLSPDGRRAVTGSMDAVARIWNRATGECERKLWGHGRVVSCACFAPDGTIIATGSSDRTAKIWNADTGECLQTLQGHAELVASVAFSPDGTCLATGSRDGTAKIWNTATGECQVTLHGHTAAVNWVAFAP